MSDPETEKNTEESLINIEFLVETPLDVVHSELFDSLNSVEGVVEIRWQNEVVRNNKASPGFL